MPNTTIEFVAIMKKKKSKETKHLMSSSIKLVDFKAHIVKGFNHYLIFIVNSGMIHWIIALFYFLKFYILIGQ